MTTAAGFLGSLSEAQRDNLSRCAHEAVFPAGARIFKEGGRADRFWIVRNGRVALDLHIPGRPAAVVDTLRSGQLLGWSWLLPPHRWHFGALAETEVRADEFDAATVRTLCEADPELGRAVALAVASVVAGRLTAARIRLLDLYGPQGSGFTG